MRSNTGIVAILGLALAGVSTARVINGAQPDALNKRQGADDCPMTQCVDFIDDCGQTYGGCGDICTGGPTFTTPFCDQTAIVTTTSSTSTPSSPSPSCPTPSTPTSPTPSSPTPSTTTPSSSAMTMSMLPISR